VIPGDIADGGGKVLECGHKPFGVHSSVIVFPGQGMAGKRVDAHLDQFQILFAAALSGSLCGSSHPRPGPAMAVAVKC